ncbi:MAG TPA: gamma carbonic anhydrase family protein [Hyphomicrobiaceae bacterium]|nr:gamma carbonic anhydrase family protein [Hyphomicrobiaceae bacterium]
MHSDLRARFPAAGYIDPTARVYGSVEIGAGSSLWPYAVIRAEGFLVRIGRCSNLQDHVMVHVGYRSPTIVGDYCSITHRVVLHGCTIGDNCLIGIGATIMEGAVIGENSIVAGHSFVADNTLVPPNSIVMGTPAKVVRTASNFIANRVNARLYRRNAVAYAKGDHRAWDGPEFEAELQRWTEEAEREEAALEAASRSG